MSIVNGVVFINSIMLSMRDTHTYAQVRASFGVSTSIQGLIILGSGRANIQGLTVLGSEPASIQGLTVISPLCQP